MKEQKVIIGISMGDLNGIGIEVILKTFADERLLNYCTPVIYGSSRVISYHRKVLRIEDFNYNIINDISKIKHNTCNIFNCWNEETSISIGRPNKRVGIYALRAIQAALYDLEQNSIDAMVTAPVNKNLINTAETPFKGHTEYITERFGATDSVMLLVSEHLRMGLVTNHVAISDVAQAITEAKIIEKIKILDLSLRKDFGIVRPKIAVLALNPHAGDNGLIGKEDEDIVKPAVAKAVENNLLAFGPYSADGFFGMGLYKQFDAVLAMYHDQGLVPFKTLSFGHGVNFTAGLPVVRTSPDHGTAYDIAGKGIANESSFRNSIFLAIDVIRNRRNYAQMTENVLVKDQNIPHFSNINDDDILE